ncbi:MAG: metallophosphoesterase family protein [Armatimonadetes bacterium]|nr:metallophosphoesterase family protein [Armatimonadota bacterium]
MRYAVISDVHGNLPALERVLEAIEREGVDRVLCLGDVVGYGASPNDCCERLREIDAIVVRGNHDEAAIRPGKEMWFTAAARACIVWTREVLTEENRQFLMQLKPRVDVDGLVLCHGSFLDPDFYTTTPREAMLTFRVMTTQICLFGHTHFAEWFEYRPGHDDLPLEFYATHGGVLQIDPDALFMINPGAVGQPRDGNPRAAYAILDVEERRVEFRRIDYDIARAQRAILEAGLPQAMAARLAAGI